MKKKIGVLTLYYKNYNFGGQLQAYALVEYLASHNFICEQICFNQHYIEKEHNSIDKYIGLLKSPKLLFDRTRNKVNSYLYKLIIFRKYNKDILTERFDEFMENSIKHSAMVYNSQNIKKTNDEYEFFIAGGDQIWNPMWTDKTFFLNFLDNSKRKISYSASAGKDFFTYSESKFLIESTKSFDFLSVREDNLQHLLASNNAKLAADPTLLISQEQWRSFSKKVNVPFKKYIFVYLLGNNKKTRNKIQKLSENCNLPIIYIPYIWRKFNINDFLFGDFQTNNIGPREFVWLIDNASLILTDSFHGVVFSTIFRKKFISFSRFSSTASSLNSRICSYLNKIGLSECFIDIDKIENIDLSYNVDYQEVSKKINAFIQESSSFLANALKS